jgi:peptide/nickel transport system ATP-binding protein
LHLIPNEQGIESMATASGRSLLEVRNLRTYFYLPKSIVKAVDGVCLSLKKGSTIGIAGETGSGKSMTALSIMRLVPKPGKITSGNIMYKGHDLLELRDEEMRRIRGKEIAMIFQDPTSYLNPYLRVGDQIVEAISAHDHRKKNDAKQIAIGILEKLGISSPSKVVNYYPHQLSGGMAQRVMIGMALSCNPSLLIADEPTSALDVTVQRQILELLTSLKKQYDISLILITHDLGVLAEICDYVYIMYAGIVVEYADISNMFEEPMHPYSQSLIKSALSIDEFKRELVAIGGTMPDPSRLPTGCRFHPRCPKAMAICRDKAPVAVSIGNAHYVSCWIYQEGAS